MAKWRVAFSMIKNLRFRRSVGNTRIDVEELDFREKPWPMELVVFLLSFSDGRFMQVAFFLPAICVRFCSFKSVLPIIKTNSVHRQG